MVCPGGHASLQQPVLLVSTLASSVFGLETGETGDEGQKERRPGFTRPVWLGVVSIVRHHTSSLPA